MTQVNISKNICIYQILKCSIQQAVGTQEMLAANWMHERSDNPTLKTSHFYVHKECSLSLKWLILNWEETWNCKSRNILFFFLFNKSSRKVKSEGSALLSTEGFSQISLLTWLKQTHFELAKIHRLFMTHEINGWTLIHPPVTLTVCHAPFCQRHVCP